MSLKLMSLIVNLNVVVNLTWLSVGQSSNESLQCCPTCGPPAACGPPAHFIWPAAVLWENVDWFEGHFPEIVKCCKKVLTMLEAHNYVCEAGFSAMNNIKSKKRNSLTDEHLENLLRAAVTQYQPQINRVAATLQSQIPHWHFMIKQQRH